MLSRFNCFMSWLVVSIRWSYWLVIASILVAVVALLVPHAFTGLPMIHLVYGPRGPHPQG